MRARRVARQVVVVAALTVRNALQYAGFALSGRRDVAAALAIGETIRLQNECAKTAWYWTMAARQAERSLARYRQYVDRTRPALGAQAATLQGRLRAIIARHDAEFAPLAGQSPVWVMSTGRCGIDTLDRVLKTAPGLHSIHREFEDEKFYEFNSAVTTKSRVIARSMSGDASDEELLAMLRAFLEVRRRTLARAGDKRHVFCEHHDEAWLPFILAAYPHSRIIHLRRDAAAVTQSFLSKGLYSGRQLVALKPGARPALEFRLLFPQVAWLCGFLNAFIAAHCAQVEPSRVMTLRSEDLFRGDPEVRHRLTAFLDAPLDPDVFTRIATTRHNAKAGGENACPAPKDWPPVFHEVLAIFGSIEARPAHRASA